MTLPIETFANDWARRAWNDSLEEGERALRDMLSESCSIEGLGGDMKDLTGPAEYGPMWRHLREAFPDMVATIEDVVPAGDGQSGTVVFSMTGTHLAEFIGKPPTGNSMTVKGVSVIWLEEGKAKRILNSWDMLGLLAQIDHAVESVQTAAARAVHGREPS